MIRIAMRFDRSSPNSVNKYHFGVVWIIVFKTSVRNCGMTPRVYATRRFTKCINQAMVADPDVRDTGANNFVWNISEN